VYGISDRKVGGLDLQKPDGNVSPVFPAALMKARAYVQAQKFGASMLIAKATRLICDSKPYFVELENGAKISTRTVVIATGAQYRKLPLENMSRFEGAGVYHGATFVEAQLCGGEEVIVVGEETQLARLQCFWHRLQNMYIC
jgi:thioredoxin reductase